MKRKHPLEESISTKKARILDEKTIARTHLCFTIFSLDQEDRAKIRMLLHTLYINGFMDSNLVKKLLKQALPKTTSQKWNNAQPMDALAYIQKKLEKKSYIKICFTDIVHDFLEKGVYINTRCFVDNKSFIHHFFDFLRRTDYGLGFDYFWALISYDKADPLLKKYDYLIKDRLFLAELEKHEQWDLLAICRGIFPEKCADHKEIAAVINDEYRTQLCMEIFNWDTTRQAQTRDILIRAINSLPLYSIMQEYRLSWDDWKVNQTHFNEFASSLIEKLFEYGVNINHHAPNQKSFVHQYYLFEEKYSNIGPGFYQITTLNQCLTIDIKFLNKLLKEEDWNTLSRLLNNDSSLAIEITPEFYQRLKQAVLREKESIKVELEWDDEDIFIFLNNANKATRLFLKRDQNFMSKLMFFKLMTRDGEAPTYLPTELCNLVSQTLIDSEMQETSTINF